MDSFGSPPPSSRSTFLTIILLTLVGGTGFVVCMGLMGGFVFYVLGLAAVFGLVAGCHWLLWGRSMSQQVTVENEAEEEAPSDTDRWTTDGPHRPHRF